MEESIKEVSAHACSVFMDNILGYELDFNYFM